MKKHKNIFFLTIAALFIVITIGLISAYKALYPKVQPIQKIETAGYILKTRDTVIDTEKDTSYMYHARSIVTNHDTSFCGVASWNIGDTILFAKPNQHIN